MQVLGSLLKLSDIKHGLPLPWWHRAPLGLLHDTPIYIALLKSENRPVGDLIVSVLDPVNWKRMKRITCIERDEPGIIERLFGSVMPLNIALAETATIETGEKHAATIVCEPISIHEDVDAEVLRSRLRQQGIENPVIEDFLKSTPDIHWHDVGKVENGWVKNTEWLNIVRNHYPNAEKYVDLDKVVVSADTTTRLLRYVFPLKGARSVEIQHADKPGALNEITRCLKEAESNVLSGLLRRGGAKLGNAVFLSVCEPVNQKPDIDIGNLIVEKLRCLGHEYRASWNISDGDDRY